MLADPATDLRRVARREADARKALLARPLRRRRFFAAPRSASSKRGDDIVAFVSLWCSGQRARGRSRPDALQRGGAAGHHALRVDRGDVLGASDAATRGSTSAPRRCRAFARRPSRRSGIRSSLAVRGVGERYYNFQGFGTSRTGSIPSGSRCISCRPAARRGRSSSRTSRR